LNLRPGDHYEITLSDGRVRNIKLFSVVWRNNEIEALKVSSQYQVRPFKSIGASRVQDYVVDIKADPIDTQTTEIIKWDKIVTVVWHQHWQEDEDVSNETEGV